METKGLTSFLIVNYNGGGMLRSCIDSIKRQTAANYEVIVVDNGSSDGSYDLPEFSDNNVFTLIRMDRNYGFSEANNIAYKHAKGDFIALVNNDVELDPNWLGEMLVVAEPQNIGSVACQLRQTNNPDLLDSVGFCMFFNGSASSWYGEDSSKFNHEHHKPFGAVAAAALYKRSAIEKIGELFHPQYFAYYEDNDLALRLRLFGYQTAYAANALGWHVGSATGKQQSDFHTYHLRRNIEYLFWVNIPIYRLLWVWPFHFAYEFFALISLICRRQIIIFFKAKCSFIREIPWVLNERKILRIRLKTLPGKYGFPRDVIGPVHCFMERFSR